MSFKKGQSGNLNGRPAGSPNKSASEFKEALNAMLKDSSPKIQEWIDRVAATDASKALDHLARLAEYVYPKLARSEITGKDGKDLIPTAINLNPVKSGT